MTEDTQHDSPEAAAILAASAILRSAGFDALLTIHPDTDRPCRIDLKPTANTLSGRAWIDQVIQSALQHQQWAQQAEGAVQTDMLPAPGTT